MTQKAITIKDLAEKLNISVSTVSRALKDNPEISQQTRKTVQALAKELGYKPNPIAVALKTHKSNTIGVVVPQIVNTFFATVVKKIEDVADKYGYNVLVASSNETFEKEKKNIDIFLANRCDGIILSISKATTSYEHIKQIQDMGVPLVLFDRTAKELDVSKVVADDADAAFKIVQHLIHGGARRIALLTGPEQQECYRIASEVFFRVNAGILVVKGKERYLKSNEACLLKLLCRKMGTVVKIEELYAGIWGKAILFDSKDKALRNLVSELRKTLEGTGLEIRNKRFAGYYLKGE